MNGDDNPQINPRQAVPSGDDLSKRLDPAIEEVLTRSMKGRTSLAPMQINPKMGKMNMGQEIGTNLINMFVPQVGTALQHFIMQQKAQQVNQVVNDFTIMHNAWERAQDMAGNDQEKAKQIFMQMPAVATLLGDKKKQKLLHKAFGVDIMNPEKTTNNVAYQGLQQFLKIKQAEGKMDQAKQMLDAVKQMPPALGGQGAPSQQQQPQQQQPQGQQQQAGPSPAEQFLNQWPQQSKQPTVADSEKAAATVKSMVTAIAEGEPKTETQYWAKAYTDEHGHRPTMADWDAHHEAWKLKPMDQLAAEALEAAENGDMDTFEQKVKLAHMWANAVHAGPHKNLIDMIYGSNAGNNEDVAALKKYNQMQIDRATAYGKFGRAPYLFAPYQMPDGSIKPISAFDIANWGRDHPGEDVPIPAGRLTSAQIVAIQQLNKEAGPKDTQYYNTGALKGVYENIGAFDNAKDRLIFANALSHVEHTSDWLATMKNALTQVEVEKLSPEGQKLYVNLQRLAESMGSFRARMNLPATDQSMSLTLALLPGKGTPNSEIAKMLLDNLNQMIQQAYVPALGKPIQPQHPKKKKDW